MMQRTKKIMIDPGHGGYDTGAVRSAVMEKDINLQIADKLFEMLDLVYPFMPFRTRNSDIFIDLRHRSAIANEINVDFFLSLHCNAYKTEEPHGIQVYYYSQGNTEIASIFLTELLKAYPNRTRWNKIARARYSVLLHTRMPALLLELGFLSNPFDRQWISNFVVQQRIVDAIVESLVRWNIKQLENKDAL